MSSMILDCPVCQNRFPFQNEGGIPDCITCPGCGKKSRSNDYSAMMFCPSCRSKLAVPLEMLDGNTINCPHCDHEFLPETDSLMNEAESAVFEDDNQDAPEKRIFQDGAFFDKYKILRILGKGGMAEVYLAEHLLLKQLCALKLMRPSLYDSNPRFIKRFIREAKITHRIKHPNIVSVYDVGSDQKTGYLFIAMEYLDGQSLLEKAKEKVLTERELLDMALTMTSALSALEMEKVVHRDIKPSNIMFCRNGTMKLMDLGVAKAESDSMDGELTLTMEQTSIGTPSYASPEQCESAHNVDIRSDIYCLGATLYHAASGHVPFGGGTPFEIMLKVLREEPVPLAKYRSDLSCRFLQLIQDMMQKAPTLRPENTFVLEKRIRECIASLEHPDENITLLKLPVAENRFANEHVKNIDSSAAFSPDNDSKKGPVVSAIHNLPVPDMEEDEWGIENDLPKNQNNFQRNNVSESPEQTHQSVQKKKQIRLIAGGERISGLITTFTGKMQAMESFVRPYLRGTLVVQKKDKYAVQRKWIILLVLFILVLIALLIHRTSSEDNASETADFLYEQPAVWEPVSQTSGKSSLKALPASPQADTASTGKENAQKAAAPEGKVADEKAEENVESVRSWYTSDGQDRK